MNAATLRRQDHASEWWNMMGGRVMAHVFAENWPERSMRYEAIYATCYEAGYRRV